MASPLPLTQHIILRGDTEERSGLFSQIEKYDILSKLSIITVEKLNVSQMMFKKNYENIHGFFYQKCSLFSKLG